jgi:D-serine deaminase-like pyridoxal phosphate-dependent protein
MRKLSPDTPYLAIDKSLLAKNIERMAKKTSKAGINLRPHVKTHKIPELAKLQLASGAVGITVATIGEAEVFAKKGIRDIFIAYPLFVSGAKLGRLVKLARKVKLTLAIDSAQGAKALAKGLKGVSVLVEIDSGHHRSGCDPMHAGEVALEAKSLGLDPVGIFTFPGHSYKPKGAKQAVADEQKALREAAKAMAKIGIEAKVISSGSTPSAGVSAQSTGISGKTKSIVNELRPGVYVFNDSQQLELGTCTANQIALWAVATVVSVNGNRLILDSGSKTLGADKAAWATGYGRLLDFPDARIQALSEHHATVVFPKTRKAKPGAKASGGKLPKIGDLIRVAPNHVCNAVNLVDRVYLVESREVVGSWKVAARGRNS